MKNKPYSLVKRRNQSALFTAGIVLAVAWAIIVFYVVTSVNKETSTTCQKNLADKQLILAQQISKYAASIAIYPNNPKVYIEVKNLTSQWRQNQYLLLKGNDADGIPAIQDSSLRATVRDGIADLTELESTLAQMELLHHRGSVRLNLASYLLAKNEALQISSNKLEDLLANNNRETLSLIRKVLFALLLLIPFGLFAIYYFVISKTGMFSPLRVEKLQEAYVKYKKVSNSLMKSIKEKKSKLEALQESEEKYRALIENSTDFIYEVTYDGYFLYASNSLLAALGMHPSEYKVLPYLAFIREDFRSKIIDYYTETVKEQKQNTYTEFPVVSRSGEEIWLGQSGSTVFNEDGRVLRFQFIARDLTQVRKLNESNERQRVMLSAILQSAKDGISVMSIRKEQGKDKVFLEWEMANPAMGGLFGKQSLIGLTLRDVLLPTEAADLEKWCFETVWSGLPREEEFRVLIGKEKKWLRVSCVSAVEGLVVTFTDVTVERQAALEIQEQKNFYETILNNMPTEVAVFSPDRHYLFLNPAAVPNAETRSWLIGKTDDEYAATKGATFNKHTRRKELFEHAIEMRDSIDWEDIFEIEGKVNQTILRQYKPIFDKDGNVYIVVGNGIEITKLKQTEADLERAKQLAEASAQARQNFINSMSHEMRTPLNCVIGLSHLLLEENPKEEQVENLQAMLFSAKNLLVLINDVLDFGKLEAGKVTVENIPYRLDELVKGIHSTFRHQALQKEIALNVNMGADVPKDVVGDPTRLTQVLTNLISNAIKFTSQGGVSIYVDAIDRSKTEATIRFSVTDTGIGIAPEKQEDIFDSFTQAESTTTRLFGGTGLGLSITKKILEIFNTQIHLDSEIGMGSTFSFDLKLGVKEVEIAKTVESIPIVDNPLEGMRILLVEDNEINRFVAIKFLTKWGVNTQVATNGVEAVEAVSKDMFDLILMDIQMPIMDGYTAASHIRGRLNHSLKDLPIIALTAAISEEVENDPRFVTMNRALPKPLNPKELQACLLSYRKN